MIYDYYCVDCGNRLQGKEISFDLAEFLGLDEAGGPGGAGNSLCQVPVEKLRYMAAFSGVTLRHGERCELELSLRDLLEIMGKNAGGQRMRSRMKKYKYSELPEAVNDVFFSRENDEVAGRLKSRYLAALRTRFELAPDVDEESEEALEDTGNYKASFLIRPQFFDDGKSEDIYTVEYAYDRNAPVFYKIKAPTDIRGYCPICGSPVLRETGKYPHVLVGMLGVQSAGKTSSIVAMMEELEDSCRSFGLKRPDNALCDSRFQDRTDNVRLYRNGWAVKKTLAETSAGTFNASLLLETEDGSKTKIVTFVDIAGEQCYDQRTEEMNAAALKVYPLIGCCDVYLLCTCIDRTGYGIADGTSANIPAKAVVQIARNIYDSQRDMTKAPPLCIVLTKADMAVDSAVVRDEHNPFRTIQIPRSNLNRTQLDNLINTYDSVKDPNVRTPLEWCMDVYNEFRTRTYVSMVSCSALGRKGELYAGDMDNIACYQENGADLPFTRTRMDVLWKWILQTIGMMDLEKGKANPLTWIPSYGEKYILQSGSASRTDVRRVYRESEAADRCRAVKQLFLNVSPDDDSVLDALEEDKPFFAGRNWREKNLHRTIESLG